MLSIKAEPSIDGYLVVNSALVTSLTQNGTKELNESTLPVSSCLLCSVSKRNKIIGPFRKRN